jgi:hypothetical protein
MSPDTTVSVGTLSVTAKRSASFSICVSICLLTSDKLSCTLPWLESQILVSKSWRDFFHFHLLRLFLSRCLQDGDFFFFGVVLSQVGSLSGTAHEVVFTWPCPRDRMSFLMDSRWRRARLEDLAGSFNSSEKPSTFFWSVQINGSFPFPYLQLRSHSIPELLGGHYIALPGRVVE